MSRIIVKNLPKNISEEKLRDLFGSKGAITDLQLKYTPDGKFRQFCFVGYHSEEEAQAAIKFFNNTCIQTSRIKVERCATLGAEDKPQSWSKHAKDSKKNASNEIKEPNEKSKQIQKKEKVSKLDEIIGSHKDDPAFQEFMKAHDKNRTLWANDAEMVTKSVKEKEPTAEDIANDAVNKKQQQHIAREDESEDDNENEVEDDDDDDDEDDDDEGTNEKLAEKPISDLEYMKSLMVSKSKKPQEEKEKQPVKQLKAEKKKAKDEIDLYTIKIRNFPYKVKRQEVVKFFKPVKPYSIRLPKNVHGFCYIGFKTEKEMKKAMLRDKSFIKGKQVFFTDFTEKNKIKKSQLKEQNEAQESVKNAKWSKQESSLQNEEDISESGMIFFRNLAYTVTEDDLQKLFERFGPVTEINLPVDPLTRQIKGFGVVTFMMPEHAVLAFNKLDGTDFHGRLLHLLPAKNKAEDELDEENEVGLSFKQKKALKLKKNAQNSDNWNTLFLGQNAVAEILSKKFGTSKEKILDTSDGGSSAAVRMALGETQIVIEMKKFLEEQGVRLKAFDSANVKRSKTIILSKNLPAGTTIEELTPIFAKFGPIGRFVLPPSGVTALIEYCDPSEARQAFKKLAYSKFKNVPLYLEWAPEETFKTTLSGEPIILKQEEKTEVEDTNEEVAEKVAEGEDNAAEANDDEPPEPSTTLFLRNLNFKTVLETVQNHFKHLGPIHTVEIAKRRDAENPRTFHSLGYGFIQFKKSATAEKALKTMQFTYIDGNQVELKRSDRVLRTPTTQRKPVTATKQTGTKILVRNIPFQAKAQEVRDIFKAFGELRSLRLPTKATPGETSHRGFGFVDFLTKSDAKTAFEALSQSTHLYGRRLVLEWASTTDDDVAEIRKRTALDFQSQSNEGKRNRKAVFNVDGNVPNADADEGDL